MSGTKRVRIPRTSAPGLVSPQAVYLYRTALRLRAKANRSGTSADRDAAHDAEADVDRLLGGGVRRLWLVSIFDVYRFQEPGNADWEQKMALRQQLDAAVSELRRQEREARRAAKAIPEPAREPEPAPAG